MYFYTNLKHFSKFLIQYEKLDNLLHLLKYISD